MTGKPPGSTFSNLAQIANWRILAAYSFGIFLLTFAIMPSIASQNAIIHTFLGATKYFMVIGGLFFAVASFIAYTRPKRPVGAPSEYGGGYGRGYRKSDLMDQSSRKKFESDSFLSRQFPVDAEERTHPTSWSLELLRSIEWKLFEELSIAYYKEKGIAAQLIRLGADGGVDIRLFQDNSGNPTSIVRSKACNSPWVGAEEIREFLGVMSEKNIPKGFYMAPSTFSEDAKEIAKANRIILIDGVMLLALIQRLPEDSQKRLLKLAAA